MEIEDLPFSVKKGIPAGFLGEYAVIGDLHLGFEEKLNEGGYNVYSKNDDLLADVTALGTKKLMMLGDVRNKFTEILPKEAGALSKFLNQLADRFDEVIITKGNHDGGLSKIASNIGGVSLVDEFSYRGTGFMHGHRMPSKSLSETVAVVCTGHLHPAVVVYDSNGVMYKKDCWMLFDLRLPKKRYKDAILKHGVVFPKFNAYIGSTDKVRREGFMRYAKITRRLSTDLIAV